MPYRIDVARPDENALDRLVSHGALDVESVGGGLAALMPDHVAPDTIAAEFGTDNVRVSAVSGRDDGSVWVLSPRAVRAGRFQVNPARMAAAPGAIRIGDGPVFGTGLHPTTALCLEALDETLALAPPSSVLDVGTGTGILALAALLGGTPRAVALDTDADAVLAAASNAQLNEVANRLRLVRGGPEAVRGSWPLVLANILAAPLIEMAPALTSRVAHGGALILSGIAEGVVPDVERVYRRLGMKLIRTETRAGWAVLLLCPSW